MINLAIVGGRDFNNYDLLKEECDKIIGDKVIISGGAKGADSLAEKYAKDKQYEMIIFEAQWNNLDANPCKIKYNSYGKPYNVLAGLNRNKNIIQNADKVIAFWDGKSRGTKNSIELAKKYNKELKIIYY